MSGHSHFATIKRKKEVTDKKRGQIFSKITRLIALAARERGGNPDANHRLKNAIEEGKKVNLPKDLIEKAIQKGVGDLSGEKLESFIFEAYGPGNISLIIEGITDNKNRALGEVKNILNKNKGKIVSEGAIKWQFSRKGILLIKDDESEELELKIIESGAENFEREDGFLRVYTRPEELEKVKQNINQEVESASIEWVAKEEMALDEKKRNDAENLFESLLESNDVQQVYSNLK